MATTKQEQARFDARLPKEQKQFFEKAASLAGYRNLTDFVIVTVQNRAKEIIEENEQIIVSRKDSEIFFNAITNPVKPNKELLSAAKEYKSVVSK